MHIYTVYTLLHIVSRQITYTETMNSVFYKSLFSKSTQGQKSLNLKKHPSIVDTLIAAHVLLFAVNMTLIRQFNSYRRQVCFCNYVASRL